MHVYLSLYAYLTYLRTLKSKMYHFERTTKDTEGRTKKDAEDIERLKKENEELKLQVADLSYKYKSAQGYLQRHLSPGKTS